MKNSYEKEQTLFAMKHQLQNSKKGKHTTTTTKKNNKISEKLRKSICKYKKKDKRKIKKSTKYTKRLKKS